VCPKDWKGGEWFRDDVEGANVRMVDSANDTSAHDVQDEGKGYDKVLNRLLAEDKI
jgi:Flp pilus assembly CpaF family ATPase